jgi:predicted RNase H-like HicB family nuclease
VVIDDLDLERVPVTPHEAQAPLVADSDAVLSLSRPSQRLQTVPRWNPQILKRNRPMQQQQLSSGYTLERAKAGDVAILEEVSRVTRTERPDHPGGVYRLTGNGTIGAEYDCTPPAGRVDCGIPRGAALSEVGGLRMTVKGRREASPGLRSTIPPEPMKKEFNVVVERDRDGFYVASIPELKGCHTQAKSLDELMARIREAAELCLEVQGNAL